MLKLPTHNRYDYSAIEVRPDYSWPDKKRLAFYVAINVEEFAFRAGRGNDPYLRTNSPQTQRNFAWRDYGLRVGIWRILGCWMSWTFRRQFFSIVWCVGTIRRSSNG
jgi:allantoinase